MHPIEYAATIASGAAFVDRLVHDGKLAAVGDRADARVVADSRRAAVSQLDLAQAVSDFI
jgi:hypothetical protein